MKSASNIPNWNKDGVWKNVEDKLHQKRKRRFFFWWFMGTTSAVLFTGFLIWMMNTEPAPTSLPKDSMAKSAQKTTAEEIQNNYSLDSSSTIDEHPKQEAEPIDAAVKLNTTTDEPLSQNNNKWTAAEIQSEELVTSVTNLKSEKNTPTFSIPQNRSIEKIASTTAVNKKIGFPGAPPILPVDLKAINFHRSTPAWALDPYSTLSQNKKEKIVSTIGWVESGLSFGKKHFINITDRNSERNATEQFRFMQTHAIGLQRFLTKNWSLKLGLAYQTIYEKYEYLNVMSEEEEILSDEGIIYNLSNNITYSEPGLATLSYSKTRHIIHNNFNHRLSIPIEMAYTFKNDQWSLEPSLGFRFQYFQQFNGIITQSGDHFFDLKAINDTYYSNNLSLGLLTSLNLKYNIFQKGALGLKLSYERDDFLKLIKNDLLSRYETIGLQLGYYRSF